MSLEVLALLTAGSVNPASVGGKSCRGDSLSKSEIAGLLAGLSDIEMAYAMAKFAGDDSAVSTVLIMTRKQAITFAVRSGWKVRPSQLKALADIATHEALSPCKCKRCGGIGFRLNKACIPCNGTGLGHESSRSMANAIGVDEAAYRRNWREKLSIVLAYLYDLESSINKKVYFNSLTTSAF